MRIWLKHLLSLHYLVAVFLMNISGVSSFKTMAPRALLSRDTRSTKQLSSRETKSVTQVKKQFQLEKESPNTPEESTQLLPSYIILATLLFTFVSNQWCRQSIYYLCDFSKEADAFRHINVALDFSQEAYASLASIVFTLFFAGFR